MDVNKDGVLEPSDIDEIVQRAIQTREGLFDEVEAKHLRFNTKKSFDRLLLEAGKGRERKISLLQWVRIIQKTNDTKRKSYFIRWFSASAVRFLFDLCDHNRDGFIDFDEFEILYKILGLNRGSTIAAFKNLDINRDGKLSKAEIYEGINGFFSSSNATLKKYVFGQYKYLSEDYLNKLITV